MAARTALSGDDRFIFARRVVTRDSSASEDHDTLTDTEFSETAKAGGFLLHWSAHGLRYGLPITLAEHLARGRNVVANISRSSITDAESVIPRIIVLNITARPETRVARMAMRGREDADAILARIAREAPLHAKRAHIINIANDGTLEDAAVRFIATLQGL